MNLRIQKIADMIDKGVVLADIGTDHAFLPILAIKHKKVQKVYACDIAKGPLEIAKRNIQAENLDGQIETILSNGFDHVPQDADVVVIAGMGYYTAKDILETAGEKRLRTCKQLIVEVNRKPELLRKWISDHHYTIDQEELITERDFDYIAISFTTDYHDSYRDDEILCGVYLQQKKGKEYLSYCDRQITFIDEVLAKYPHDDDYRKELLQQKKYWLEAK